jgi:CHAT domain-containing protein/tetratricopeptide (TPR) repeat protein
MKILRLVFLSVLLPAPAAVGEPPYKQLLQGDDARKAAALKKQMAELWATGQFAEAAAPAAALLALRRRVQGEGHWQTADAARKVETLRQAAGLPEKQRQALAALPGLLRKARDHAKGRKYAQAEGLYRKALAASEQTLGAVHPDTAARYGNLADNLHRQGRHREAEPLFRKSLALCQRGRGPRHPLTATCYGNLAINLGDQGRYGEAEPLCRKALAITVEVLGPRNSATATCYNNLAANLGAQGRYREAEPLVRKALAIREKVLGPRHAATATAYSNLAANLGAQGRYREAEPLVRRVLAIDEEALGPNDPATATGYNNMAVNLHAQGRYREAEAFYRKALAIKEEALGPRHPRTAESINNLAYNLTAQRRHGEAEALYRKALAIFEEALGPRHPLTATGCSNLASNLGDQRRHDEAEPLLRRALALVEEVRGPRHPDTARGYNNLAVHLGAQGRHRPAEVLFRKALGVCQAALGPSHPRTTRTDENLALILQAQGRAREAEPLWRAAVEGLEAGRLRLAATGLDRAAAHKTVAHLGLAHCLARQKQPAAAWRAAEAGLARGLLDDLVVRAADLPSPDEDRRLRVRAARLEQLDAQLLPLLTAEKQTDAGRKRRDDRLRERSGLQEEIAREAAELSGRAVFLLDRIQKQLPADGAVVFWLDLRSGPKDADAGAGHWACIVRRAGAPAWVRLPGSGPGEAWTAGDRRLAGRLRVALAGNKLAWQDLARRLADQRLGPLAPHLAGTTDVPAVRQLIAIPFGGMAGIPLEVLTEHHALSYAPSATVYARLREQHRPLRATSLLALGDPAFQLPGDPPPPRERAAVADARRRDDVKPLPGTRFEVEAVRALFPTADCRVLLGSQASEQHLEALAAAGKLKDFRVLHLATHGQIDRVSARDSALLLARDKLPDPLEQARQGRKVYDGRLSVAAIADTWQLDADLVTLSACQTGLGPSRGGDGLLGFSHVLLARGARSLVVSLWKVDDTATALLMARFYANLLGRREGLKAPLPRAVALREAQRWLRELPRSRRDALATALAKGELRGEVVKLDRPVLPAPGAKDRPPYAHPYYWAAFILLGDPD